MTSSKADPLGDNSLNDDESIRTFLEGLAYDDGEAAISHLAAGRWITYRDPHASNGLVREWPNGQRELIKADLHGNVIVLKPL